VGKTVFAALLIRHLRARDFRVAGLKPICSGGRGDALALQEAAGKVLTLDEVNPWHFRAPIAPLLAARREHRCVTQHQVTSHIRHAAKHFDVVVVEGAGGLLSPLGAGFDSRDLIRALRAVPVVVCANRLGVVNQALLVLSALPREAARHAQTVLMATARADFTSRLNPPLLRELAGRIPVHELPNLRQPAALDAALRRAQVRRTLDAVLHELADRLMISDSSCPKPCT
jgi:dethiobiotin synthetase